MMKIKLYLSKIILLILITTSLLILSVNTSSTITASSLIDHKKSSPSIQALVDLAPIEIISDDNFTDYGFTGAGTAADPYVIENYNITTTSYRGILVKGTTKHFVIRFCYIDSAGYGINFEYVAAGTAKIYNTTLNENGWAGIYLDYSSSVEVINVTATNNYYYGISLDYSPGAIMINNTIDNNGAYGIDMWHSTNTTLTNNSFYNDGVYIYDTSLTNYLNFSFTNNWVNGRIPGYFRDTADLSFISPNYSQLILINCDNPTIYNQDLSNTAIGMLLYWCDNADILNNTCNNNRDGIYLEDCSYSNVVNNSCSNNLDDGLKSVYDQGSTFVNNTCNNNGGYGLWLFISDDCMVSNNICNDNEWLGIYLWACSGNILIDNTCINSNNWGILLQDSNTCLIAYNLIQYCTEYGMYLDASSYDNIIFSNRFEYNNLGGTSQGYDNGTSNIWYDSVAFVGNWWSDWNGIPPYPIDGDANNIDLFPDGPIIFPEFQTGIQLIFILCLIGVSAVTLSIITKKRSRN